MKVLKFCFEAEFLRLSPIDPLPHEDRVLHRIGGSMEESSEA